MIKTKSYALGGVTSDWLAWELDGNHRPSRENVTIAVKQNLSDGTVVSYNDQKQIQAYTAQDNEVPVGIYVGETIATTNSDLGQGVIVARSARIVPNNIRFAVASLTDEQLATALADLAKINITTVRQA